MANSANNSLTLSTKNGVEVDLELTPEATTETITTTSEGGETDEAYHFKAKPATNIEGYYPVKVPSKEGKVVGTSWSGAKLEGRRSGPHISVKITPPGGGGVKPVAFEFSAATLQGGENRWIVLQEGEGGQLRIKGAKQQVSSSGFIDPTTGL